MHTQLLVASFLDFQVVSAFQETTYPRDNHRNVQNPYRGRRNYDVCTQTQLIRMQCGVLLL